MSTRILSANTSDAAILTSADFLAGLPVTNLQVEGRGSVARTANVTGNKVINGNFAGASIVSACILYSHNLSSQATIRLQIWDAANQTGNIVYDSGTGLALPPIGWGEFQWGLSPWGANVFTGWGRAFTDMWFAPVAGLSFRITLSDPLNPAGYIQVKRLLIGPYFEPGVNVSYGLNVQWDTNDEQIRTQGGSLRTDNRVMFRTMRGTFGHLTTGERGIFMDILRRIGKRTETFVSVWPEAGGSLERDNALLGKFVQMPDLTNGNLSSYSSQLVFEEV